MAVDISEDRIGALLLVHRFHRRSVLVCGPDGRAEKLHDVGRGPGSGSWLTSRCYVDIPARLPREAPEPGLGRLV
jgi:hypothetical protein